MKALEGLEVKPYMEESDLADLIKTCRITANMSQAELAAKLNLERSYISKFENGALIPNGIIIKLIGKVTDCEELITSFFSPKETWQKIHRLKTLAGQVKSALEIAGISV